jgi:hypothetical protein
MFLEILGSTSNLSLSRFFFSLFLWSLLEWLADDTDRLLLRLYLPLLDENVKRLLLSINILSQLPFQVVFVQQLVVKQIRLEGF